MSLNFAPNTRNGLIFWCAMGFYAVLCFVVPEALGHIQAPWARALLAVSPAVPLAATVWVFVLQLLQLDEFQQRLQMIALAIAAGVTILFATAWGFLELHIDAPDFPLFLIMPTYVLAWGIATKALSWSYQ
jgi:hypothetical protein